MKMMKRKQKRSIDTHTFLRGAATFLAGILLMYAAAGCNAFSGHGASSESPPSWPRTVYSDGIYDIVQDAPVHSPSPHEGLEYVFIPLTFTNGSRSDILFSSYVCIKSCALPSGCACLPADKDAIAVGQSQIEGFRLFDGVIPGRSKTAGWFAFELPRNSETVHVNFLTGREDETLSFDCPL
ncbi:MAG: hypothetical protein II828_06580 [Clostridia bacterium]|nr:hypothetical protein [Clostridia bacterium]